MMINCSPQTSLQGLEYAITNYDSPVADKIRHTSYVLCHSPANRFQDRAEHTTIS